MQTYEINMQVGDYISNFTVDCPTKDIALEVAQQAAYEDYASLGVEDGHSIADLLELGLTQAQAELEYINLFANSVDYSVALI